MKRLMVWIVSTSAGVVLLFSYHTSTSGPAAGRVVSGVAPVGVVAESPAAQPTAPASAASSAASAPTAAPARTAAATRTVNGASIDTRYGPVQVQVTLRGSRIVSSNAINYPTGGRDSEINDRAIPLLNDEAVQAQSASVDTVSGASYTSDGYRQSLQSALDAAGR